VEYVITPISIHEKRRYVVEKGLGTIGKLKILRLLLKEPDHAFTKYEINKRTSLSPDVIGNSLESLVALDWVKEIHIQHLTKYYINLKNADVCSVRAFFGKVKYS
jgi:hypothetical protein